MAQLRTRKDVWKFAEWDPILLFYAKAIAKMQSRPMNDPTSWRYQAAVHDYIRANDPNAKPGDPLPKSRDQKQFWRQCQHNSWFFLPWHRMYLTYFEQIVGAAVAELGGPKDWALPYWNYSDPSNPNARKLPPAFRASKLPDGTPNPLRVAERNRGCNEGHNVADESEVNIRPCLIDPTYAAAPAGGNPGFGGPKTAFSHSGQVTGKLEAVPHGSVHVAVGGWMGAFETAGLDPIFWLHHCNIDRLWTVWLRRDSSHTDPHDPKWLKSLSFHFHDASGKALSMTSNEVVDTSKPPMSYEYEDVSDPFPSAPKAAEKAARLPMPEETPEMVGATEEPVTLTNQRSEARLAVKQPTGPARAAHDAGAPPRGIHLNFENITATGQPENYAVYLNLPPNSQPADHPELLAGILSTFGAAESSRTDDEHPGGGVHRALEVGEIVQTLQARKDWDPNHLRVTFIPKNRRTAGEETGAAPPPIRVGRISLYYS